MPPCRPASSRAIVVLHTASCAPLGRSTPEIWYFRCGVRVYDGLMDLSPSVERARREIVRLCHAGLDGPTLTLEVLGRLRRAVGIDAFWCATADPATVLFTGATREEIPDDATPRFLTNEFLQEDINKFAALASSSQPVNSLYAATGGEPERSPRYRDILVPMGFGDELRAALTVGGACWGVSCRPRGSRGRARQGRSRSSSSLPVRPRSPRSSSPPTS